MEKLKRSLGSFIVPLLSIILAFVIGGIIMAALGAPPVSFTHLTPPTKRRVGVSWVGVVFE